MKELVQGQTLRGLHCRRLLLVRVCKQAGGGFREARRAGVGAQVAGPERARGAGAKNKRAPHSRSTRPLLANQRGPSSRGPLIGCTAANHTPKLRAPAAPRGVVFLAREGRGAELGLAWRASGT